MERRQLTAVLRNKKVIGITGHRDVIPEIEDVIKAKLSGKLKELSKGNKELVLLTSLASGGDQLAAEVAFNAHIPFIVILPMKIQFYEKDFKVENERLKLNDLLGKKFEIFSIDDEESEKHENERDLQYEKAGHLIIACSDHLIALWDGVYTGECGGTSEIVRMALSGIKLSDSNLFSLNSIRKQSGCLHHLLIPRKRNPFPVADPKISFFPLRELEWGKIIIPAPKTKQPAKFKVWYNRYKDFLLKFIIPLLLVLVTVILGYNGFCELNKYDEHKYDRLNAFYASVNLITLNSSVLESSPGAIPLKLQIARITGFLTAIYAIFGAFLWAASDLRKRAVIFLWGKNFYLVVGLNEKSFSLIQDLRSRKIRIAVLNDDANSAFIKSCENLGAVVYQGNPSEISDLNYVYFKKARNIYVFTESDIENVRIMQEIDEHVEQNSKNYNREFYVHINDLKQKEFLARTTRSDISIFNVYENAARRLLIKHPIDRFQYNYYTATETKLVKVIVIGFDKLARELVMSILKMGHYPKNIYLELLIFTEGEEQRISSEKFKDQYGRIFRNSDEINGETIFLQPVSAKVEFEVLPESDAVLTDPKNSIFKGVNITRGASINIFTCLADSLKSAACLSLLLPRLDYLKCEHTLNMQIFCYYNSPDEIEEAYIEYKINKIGTHIPVYCFGNFLKTCTEDVIRNSITDQLAKQLAFWYYLIYGFQSDTSDLSKSINKQYANTVETLQGQNIGDWMIKNASHLQNIGTPVESRIEKGMQLLDTFWNEKSIPVVKDWWNKCWILLTEDDKESNRQAADHIFIKLRCIGKSLFGVKLVDDLGIHNIELLSSMEHNRWCTEKFIDGWHSFDNKDEWFKKGKKAILKKQKLHYDLRDFEMMEQYERKKDHNQVIGIPYFLRALSIK